LPHGTRGCQRIPADVRLCVELRWNRTGDPILTIRAAAHLY
jgi:hypothetical protein